MLPFWLTVFLAFLLLVLLDFWLDGPHYCGRCGKELIEYGYNGMMRCPDDHCKK